MSVFGRIRSWFARAPKVGATASFSGSVLPDQALWAQFFRIGGGLTPQAVSEIIRAADSGDMCRLVDLANEMRQKDGHLQSVLQTRETALAGLPWELIVEGQKPKKKRTKRQRGERERKFCHDALTNHRDFRRLIAHLTGANYYGYAVAETVWKRRGGKLYPERFVCHSPRRFGFRLEDGRFIWRDQDTAYGGVDFLEKWPDKFIVSQPRVNGDVPCREGLVRVLMWLALFRNWSIADWLKLAELAWKPWRIGVFERGATDEDKQILEAILAGMTSSGAAMHSEAVRIDLKYPEASGSGSSRGGTHDALFDVCGREMSKAVVGQTLTTETGPNGNRSLGAVHNDVRRDILIADAEHLAEVITRDIIEPMVRLNFGPTAVVPRFRFVIRDAKDLKQTAEALAILTGAKVGLKVSEDYVYDELGIPKPDEDDDLLGVWCDLSDLNVEPENDPPDGDPGTPDGDAEEQDDEPEDDDVDEAA